MPTLKMFGLQQLLIAFCQGHNMGWIHLQYFCFSLRLEKQMESCFYALSGCDVVGTLWKKAEDSVTNMK